MNFREFLEQNTVGTHNDGAGGAYVDSLMTGSGSMSSPSSPIPLGGVDLQLPSVTKQAPIKYIEMRKTPILIQLGDGTRLYLSLDEYNRIKGSEPRVGKIMRVVFQRHDKDQTQSGSQIQSITCY